MRRTDMHTHVRAHMCVCGAFREVRTHNTGVNTNTRVLDLYMERGPLARNTCMYVNTYAHAYVDL